MRTLSALLALYERNLSVMRNSDFDVSMNKLLELPVHIPWHNVASPQWIKQNCYLFIFSIHLFSRGNQPGQPSQYEDAILPQDKIFILRRPFPLMEIPLHGETVFILRRCTLSLLSFIYFLPQKWTSAKMIPVWTTPLAMILWTCSRALVLRDSSAPCARQVRCGVFLIPIWIHWINLIHGSRINKGRICCVQIYPYNNKIYWGRGRGVQALPHDTEFHKLKDTPFEQECDFELIFYPRIRLIRFD